MKPNLIFGDPDAARVELLRQGFASHPEITACAVKSAELTRATGADAIFLTIMAAERWGAKPITHQAQVLRTNQEDQFMGWPAFVIAGVAAKPGDPRDPEFELRMIVLAVLRAATSFNAASEQPVRHVAFGPEWIGIKKLAPLKAAEIICSAYDETHD